MNLSIRLMKLEEHAPAPERRRPVIRIVASDQEEAEARKQLEAEGFDPDSGHIAIIRLIAVPPGRPPLSRPLGIQVLEPATVSAR
jgi:hypothetical protein